MLRRWFAVVLVPLVFIACPTARAQQAAAPAVVVRVKSLDALLKNLNLVVKLVGQDEAANQIEGLIKSKIGKNGLEGIDTSRPFGGYVRFGKSIDDLSGAILAPIVDEKSFLTLLDNLGVQYVKGKGGIYTHTTSTNVDLYFRFAHRYLYITSLNAESLQDQHLVDPVKALAVKSEATLALVARVDRIPDDAKRFALSALSDAVASAQKAAPPKETKLQEEFRVAMLRDADKLGASIIKEAAEIQFDIDIADAAKELTVNLAIVGKPGSDLAKSIQSIGQLKSPLSGLADKDAAFQGSAHLALPGELQKALNDLIDEAAAKSLAAIDNEAKKKQAQALFQALLPTAKAGDFQVIAALFGPQADRYTVLAGVKLKDGVKLGDTVRELVKESTKDIPPDLAAKIALDFDTVGAVKIHKFDLPKTAETDKLMDIFGDTSLYVAFRDDALLVAIGKEALPTLKGAIAKSGNVASLPLLFDFDFARMAKLAAQTPEQKELAAKLFANGQNGRVRLSIEGGTALTARLQMRLNVLEFLAKVKKDKE